MTKITMKLIFGKVDLKILWRENVPAVARIGDKCVVDCSPPTLISGSGDVKVNGVGVVRQGDSTDPHKLKKGRCPIHESKVTGGSGSVFVNGKPIARVGDALGPECTQISQGSGDVFAG
jgi:uncharacterized Zn-binding protein involved in type VI secretion